MQHGEAAAGGELIKPQYFLMAAEIFAGFLILCLYLMGH